MHRGDIVGDSWSVLLTPMRELRATWPSRGWSWDSRMTCVSSSFHAELDADARAAAHTLSSEWTSTTIQRAPSHLRDLAERTGGLRAGQKLVTTPTVGASYLYGLWWPWGDGMTTSMRIGLGGPDATSDAYQRLRDVFGVQL